MQPCRTYVLRQPTPLHDHACIGPPRRSRRGCPVILLNRQPATVDAHAAVESHSALLDPGLSRATHRATHRACLRRLFGHCAPPKGWVPRSQAWHRAGPACGDRHKTRQLVQDLVALGVTTEELAQTPLRCGLPDLHTTAGRFGCLSAIEGGTLGGQVVTRHLQPAWRSCPSPTAGSSAAARTPRGRPSRPSACT